jgi:hypothetical protein
MAESAQQRGSNIAGLRPTPQCRLRLRGRCRAAAAVLTNLIGNAIKFTMPAEVSWRFSLERESAAESSCAFSVAIRHRPLRKNSAAFRAVSTGRSLDDSQNTVRQPVLGLAISRQHPVEKMAGRIGRSKALRGNGLDVLVHDTNWEKQPAILPPAPGGNSTRKYDASSFADDNATSGSFLHEQIVAWRFRNTATTVTNGADALERASAPAQRAGDSVSARDPRISRCPTMDGLSLARAAIKEDDPPRHRGHPG